MGFECRICGTCCMYLGDYIVIEKQTGQYTFDCCCVSTGTEFSAEVDLDKRNWFDDHTFSDQNPTACPVSPSTWGGKDRMYHSYRQPGPV